MSDRVTSSAFFRLGCVVERISTFCIPPQSNKSRPAKLFAEVDMLAFAIMDSIKNYLVLPAFPFMKQLCQGTAKTTSHRRFITLFRQANLLKQHLPRLLFRHGT